MKIKTFIKSWNFANPNWGCLPLGFPNCNLQGLTIEEKHLFSAIQLAWMISVGKTQFYKDLARRSFAAIGIGLILILGSNLFLNPKSSISKAVNAATISATFKQSQIQVQDVLESTASALFKSAH